MEALGDALDLEHKSVWAMEEGQKTALAKLRCGMAMPYCGLGLLASTICPTVAQAKSFGVSSCLDANT